jgi:hypothetical protein
MRRTGNGRDLRSRHVAFSDEITLSSEVHFFINCSSLRQVQDTSEQFSLRPTIITEVLTEMPIFSVNLCPTSSGMHRILNKNSFSILEIRNTRLKRRIDGAKPGWFEQLTS